MSETRGEEILVVDGDAKRRSSTLALLRSAGLHARGAASGRSALNLARLHQPDLMLVNLEVLGVGWQEYCRQCKDESPLQDIILVLFASETVDNSIPDEALMLGVDKFIPFPVDDQDLLSRLIGLLRMHTTQNLPFFDGVVFSTLTEYSSEWEYVQDQHHQILFMNPACERVTGYKAKVFFEDAGLLKKIIRPEDLPLFEQQHHIVREQKKSVGFEYRIITNDGRERWISLLLVPVCGKDGIFLGWRASNRDVTDLKSEETILRESENRYRGLFENLNVGVAVFECVDEGNNFIFKDYNHAAELIENDHREELIGRSVFEMRPGIEEFGLAEVFRTVWRTGRPAHHPISLYQDNRMSAWYENFVYKLPSGEIVAIFDDITERMNIQESVRGRADELAALQTTVLEITAQQDATNIFQAIVERAAHLLNAEGGGLYLCDPERREVRCVVSYNTSRDFTGVVLKYGEGAAGIVALTGQPMRVDDYRQWSGRADIFEQEQPFRTLVSAPMLWQGRVTGVIHVLRFTDDHPFTQKNQELLALFANHASIAAENSRLLEGLKTELVENARLYQEALQASARHSVLHRTSQEISTAGLDLEAVYASIHHAIEDLMPFEVLLIGTLDKDNQEVNFIYAYDSGDRILGEQAPVGLGIAGQVVEEGVSIRIRDYRREKRKKLPPFGKGDARSILAVPIFMGTEITGVISVQSYRPNLYTQEHQVVIEILAASAGAAIDNARLFDQVQKKLRESEALRQASQALNSSLEIQPLMNNILMAAQRAIPAAERGTILLVETGNILKVRASTGYEDKRFPNLSINPDEGYASQVFTLQRPVCIQDARSNYVIPFGDQIEEVSNVLSAIAAPLTVKGERLGVISLDNASRKSAFSEEDLALLVSFASSAATAIQNARLLEQTTRRTKLLDTLHEVSQKISHIFDLEALGEVTIPTIQHLLGWERGSLWLNKDDGTYQMLYHDIPGLNSKARVNELERLRSLISRPGEGIIGWVLQNGVAIRTGDVERDPHYIAGIRGIQSELCVPILSGGKITGCVNFESGRPDAFSPEDEQALFTLAGEIASALDRIRLFDQTRRQTEQVLAVNEIGHLLSETLELDQVYSKLVSAIHNLLPELCAIFILLFDKRTQTVTYSCAYIDGAFLDTREMPQIQFDPSSRDRISSVLQKGEPLSAKKLGTGNKHEPHLDLIGTPTYRPESAMYIPMISKGSPIGLIQVLSYKPDFFSQQDIALLSLVANTAAITIENARLFTETQKRLRYLSALHNIDATISASVDLRVTLNIILETITKELRVDAAAMALINPHMKTLEYTASRGFRARIIEGMRLRLGEGLAGQAVTQRRLISISRSSQTDLDLFTEEDFAIQFAVPLIAKGQVQGVLQIFHRSMIEPDLEWTNFLNTLGGQAAIAMDNARLFDTLQRSNLELTLAYDATIQGWSQAMELRDKETQGHTERVLTFTMRLAQAMNLGDTETVHLRRGVLLHDIGKMGIPDSILLKPGPLSEEEWEIMRMHPVYAFDMLSGITYLHQALDVPYCHHEKWDGSGYPRGLRGNQIPLAARIFTVVDVYDALTSDRPYRKAWRREQALEYLRDGSGKLFDSNVVETFLRLDL